MVPDNYIITIGGNLEKAENAIEKGKQNTANLLRKLANKLD